MSKVKCATPVVLASALCAASVKLRAQEPKVAPRCDNSRRGARSPSPPSARSLSSVGATTMMFGIEHTLTDARLDIAKPATLVHLGQAFKGECAACGRLAWQVRCGLAETE